MLCSASGQRTRSVALFLAHSVVWLAISLSWFNCYHFCHAQLRSGRFLIDLFADAADVLSRIPANPIKRTLLPILMRSQNKLVTSFPLKRSGPAVLSNDYREVQFRFYGNSRKPGLYLPLDLEDAKSIPPFHIRRGSQIKILIHGYNYKAKKRDRFPAKTKDAYLYFTPHSVITVDWIPLATPRVPSPPTVYPAVADNVPRAALRVFHLIQFLLEKGVIHDLRQVHIVGFSLGGHVAARTAQLVKGFYGKKIGRVTGLDPAGPIFKTLGPDYALDRTDADFVDVIHTSASGIPFAIGHVDFFPNGGQAHPHCLKLRIGQFSRCNHEAAFEFFNESIIERNVTACACKSYKDFRGFCGQTCHHWTHFGEYVSRSARGKFFLDCDLRESF